MKKGVALLLVGPVLLAWVSASTAAPRLGPPTLFMVEEGHRSAVVEVIERLADGRFRARTVKRLHGETPDELVLTGGGGLLVPGGRYVIGHTDKPFGRSPRPDATSAGPRLLTVPAVGAAVFEDTPAMRRLVSRRNGTEPLDARGRLDALLEQLARPDVQARRFVTLELALDQALARLADEDDIESVRRTLAAGDLETLARDHLLRASRGLVEDRSGEWLAAECRRVLASHGRRLDLASFVPSLLVTALETLEQTGTRADAELASRHVASNNPGVGKAAFSALAALDPELAARGVPEYLEDGEVHPDTRRHVARLAARLGPVPGNERDDR